MTWKEHCVLVDNTLAPNATLSGKIHETRDLLITDTTRRPHVDVAFQPDLTPEAKRLP